ncbi:hypothetical protein I3843_01G073300 [Carya illinoinensis]|uniref:LOB domain-containing protein n=1 Tax=Carya illinoinensis TaxID=32201 RepID=A0A8T1RJ52_CARIL|nr:LOB domain-containing protein 11-like [Carya illinoinensis]KAG6667107.1 hypothetical protein CIPAW_01G077900 [Carya illinoinensis]KAG6730349.1 hypothetical protein I3842_01G075000 [Carya illinoinensis]KAG7994740.1 hypothetical protein I3843_01G073300 [Carya illinoinensis]
MGSQDLARGCRVQQPCAACRMLRRKCERNCLLAPYFPCEEMDKFAGVHKVFGASNVIKMIQMVDEACRDDAVKAIVYEATARLRDPVYGSVGPIFHLQKMVEELKAQLESIKAQILESQQQRDQMLGILMNVHHTDLLSSIDNPVFDHLDGFAFANDTNMQGFDPVVFPPEFDWDF